MRALRSGLVTLAILLDSSGVAAAQQGENLASPQQKAEQEKAQHTKAGRAGTTEPSLACAERSSRTSTAVFVRMAGS